MGEESLQTVLANAIFEETSSILFQFDNSTKFDEGYKIIAWYCTTPSSPQKYEKAADMIIQTSQRLFTCIYDWMKCRP